MSLVNQPPHFFAALLALGMFALATFGSGPKVKSTALILMRVGFAILLVSGLVLLFTLPFSLWVLVKSAGGLVLFWGLDTIARGKGGTFHWVLVGGIAAVGLAIAYLLI